jgi:hypothetical protein
MRYPKSKRVGSFKSNNMKRILFLSVVIVALFNSCSKDKYGNTDISSDTYMVGWTFVDPSYRTDITEPLINQDVIDNGAVMVYKSNDNGGWVALPCTLPIDATYASTYSFVIYDGGVTIWKTDTDLLTLDPGVTTFKVVILSKHGLIQHPNLDLTDYDAVEKEFNL